MASTPSKEANETTLVDDVIGSYGQRSDADFNYQSGVAISVRCAKFAKGGDRNEEKKGFLKFVGPFAVIAIMNDHYWLYPPAYDVHAVDDSNGAREIDKKEIVMRFRMGGAEGSIMDVNLTGRASVIDVLYDKLSERSESNFFETGSTPAVRKAFAAAQERVKKGWAMKYRVDGAHCSNRSAVMCFKSKLMSVNKKEEDGALRVMDEIDVGKVVIFGSWGKEGESGSVYVHSDADHVQMNMEFKGDADGFGPFKTFMHVFGLFHEMFHGKQYMDAMSDDEFVTEMKGNESDKTYEKGGTSEKTYVKMSTEGETTVPVDQGSSQKVVGGTTLQEMRGMTRETIKKMKVRTLEGLRSLTLTEENRKALRLRNALYLAEKVREKGSPDTQQIEEIMKKLRDEYGPGSGVEQPPKDETKDEGNGGGSGEEQPPKDETKDEGNGGEEKGEPTGRNDEYMKIQIHRGVWDAIFERIGNCSIKRLRFITRKLSVWYKQRLSDSTEYQNVTDILEKVQCLDNESGVCYSRYFLFMLRLECASERPFDGATGWNREKCQRFDALLDQEISKF